jgi:Holliday junction resolvase RusA-like endonuclease
MNIYFTVPGPPRGKGRPRFARTGSGVRTYTPTETAAYENLVRLAFDRAAGYKQLPKQLPIVLTVHAHCPIPKSYSKRFREGASLDCNVPHPKKPDMDNVVKAVLDGLNGAAFADDAQVYSIRAEKWYSANPRLEVTLHYMELT